MRALIGADVRGFAAIILQTLCGTCAFVVDVTENAATYSELYMPRALFVVDVAEYAATSSEVCSTRVLLIAAIYFFLATTFSRLATISVGFMITCSSFATDWFKLTAVC